MDAYRRGQTKWKVEERTFKKILVRDIQKMLGLFGTLKLALALQFIVMNDYFSVACNTKVSVRATLK